MTGYDVAKALRAASAPRVVRLGPDPAISENIEGRLALLERLAQESGDRNLVTVMSRLFESAGGQIKVDSLVEIVARVWHIPPDPEPSLTIFW